MELHVAMVFELPDELIKRLNINEDTVFEAYFDNGSLYVRPVSDEEIAEIIAKEMEEW